MANNEDAGANGSPRLLTLRLKCESNANQILKNVSEDLSLRELYGQISELTGVPSQFMILLAGYPPKKLPFSLAATVKSLGLSLQDTLNVQRGADKNWGDQASSVVLTTLSEEDRNAEANGDPEIEEVAIVISDHPGNTLGAGRKRRKDSANVGGEYLEDRSSRTNSGASSSQAGNSSRASGSTVVKAAGGDNEVVWWETQEAASNGFMLRHTVPNDNSCLFWAALHVLGTKGRAVGTTNQLRRIIADTVANNPDHFNEVYLGRSNEDYQRWICIDQSWGGAIELAILAQHFAIEFAVVNIQAQSIFVFGEDKGYATRVYLIYDGIHYDALHLESFYGGDPVTEFRHDDQNAYTLALEIGIEAYNSNQYTDITNFTLRCSQCNEVLVGDEAVRKHTKATNHNEFEEMKPPF